MARASDEHIDSRDLVTLGSRIRTARTDADLSIRRLAERIGVHHATIARIESGEFDQPAMDILHRLAQALELDEADLYALAGYRVATSLPGLPAYLRAKYDMPAEAAAQLNDYFRFLADKHGIEERSDRKRPAA